MNDSRSAQEAPLAIADRVSRERLCQRLQHIIGERHHLTSPDHHRKVAGFIRDTLTEHGWPVTEQEVPGPHGTGANLIARRAGSENPERTWILGAHYDSVIGTPGADDNGIAVAGVLEVAEILAGASFRDSVELVAWDMEEAQNDEVGGLLGSTVMASEAYQQGRDIAGVLDFEMIGLCRNEPDTQNMPLGFGLLFPKMVRRVKARGMRGDFLTGVGNRASKTLLQAFGRAAEAVDLPFLPIPITGPARLVQHFYRSDHAPFWLRGYPAVMLTDTADFRNGHYHQPSDTIETIDFDFAARVTAAAALTLLDLAGGRLG